MNADDNQPVVSSQVRVLGVRIDCLDMEAALDRIEALVEAGGPHLVATANPELVMRARRDPAFARVLESASLCLADGWGVVWAARRRGAVLAARVTGTDLVPLLARRCAERGWSIFLLGGAPGVAEQAARRLYEAAPGLVVAGVSSGSAAPEADASQAGAVSSARPKVLLVAFGAPRQELWIDRNRLLLGVPVAIGVGGAFDFLSGRIARAPEFMRRRGLEWLFRLARQPWRAGRMMALPRFAIAAWLEEGRTDGPTV